MELRKEKRAHDRYDRHSPVAALRGGGGRFFVEVGGLRRSDALLAEGNWRRLRAMVKLTDADDWLTLDQK